VREEEGGRERERQRMTEKREGEVAIYDREMDGDGREGREKRTGEMKKREREGERK